MLGIGARITAWIKSVTKEDAAVALFGASFFVGVWYALPMLNTITDVWAFGGGVLRSMEAHTLLPGYGVAYGTVSFYQNYLVMALALLASLPFFAFDLEALKMALVLNPSYTLVVSRLVSALTAVAFLFIVHRFLKNHVPSVWWRLTLLMLAFGNVLAVLLVRSGKMWILSIGLGIISFIYLYEAITKEAKTGTPGAYSAISIVSAFLAAANFMFAGLFLITIPILLYVFPRTAATLKRLVVIAASGVAVFFVFLAANFHNIIEQVSGFVLQFSNPSSVASAEGGLTFFESLGVNARQAVESFPLLLLALVPAWRAGVRDKLLAGLALLYFVLYLLALSILFRSDQGLALNVRHVFPLGFFLMFMLAACAPPRRLVSVAFFAVGCAVYIYTLVLLSVPTTYNAALDYVVEQYGQQQVRIDEDIFELSLPMNKASYALLATSSCGSACVHAKALETDIAFAPVVVTGESDPAAVQALPAADLLVVEEEATGCVPLAYFGNNTKDEFDIDINLGRMLLPSFWHLNRLGKNIYVYDAKSCDTAVSIPASGK